jgi:hypothetical protein
MAHLGILVRQNEELQSQCKVMDYVIFSFAKTSEIWRERAQLGLLHGFRPSARVGRAEATGACFQTSFRRSGATWLTGITGSYICSRA